MLILIYGIPLVTSEALKELKIDGEIKWPKVTKYLQEKL